MTNVRPTAQSIFLVNAHDNPPVTGQSVLALTRGGKLVETVWKTDSLLYFDAWCKYPKVPDDVKKLQLSRL